MLLVGTKIFLTQCFCFLLAAFYTILIGGSVLLILSQITLLLGLNGLTLLLNTSLVIGLRFPLGIENLLSLGGSALLCRSDITSLEV